jgi:hypothetical protein
MFPSTLLPSTYQDSFPIPSDTLSFPNSITSRYSHHTSHQTFPANTVTANTYTNLAHFFWFDQVSNSADNPPTGYIMSPTNVFSNPNMTLTAKAIDDVGVASVTVSINGAPPALMTRVTGNIQNGNHRLTGITWLLGQNLLEFTVTDTSSQMYTFTAIVTLVTPPPLPQPPITPIPIPCMVTEQCKC